MTHYRNTIRRQVSNLRALFYPGYLHLERDIKLYENWSIEAALAMNCKKEQDHIVRCPIPNCENLWLIPKKYREKKMKAEESYLRLLVGPGNDRKIHCDSCNVDFCCLCQRPWANFYHPSKGHSGVSCVKYARQCTVLENDDGYAAVAFIAGAQFDGHFIILTLQIFWSFFFRYLVFSVNTSEGGGKKVTSVKVIDVRNQYQESHSSLV